MNLFIARSLLYKLNSMNRQVHHVFSVPQERAYPSFILSAKLSYYYIHMQIVQTS